MKRITPAGQSTKQQPIRLPNLPLVLRARRDKRRHVVGVSSTIGSNGSGNNNVASSSTKSVSSSDTSKALTFSGNHSFKKNTTENPGCNDVNNEVAVTGNCITLYHIRDMIDLGIQEILSLAVRYDESFQDEKKLLVPFELSHIRIHSSDISQFVTALEYLYDKTQCPLFFSSLSSRRYVISSLFYIVPSIMKLVKLLVYQMQRIHSKFPQSESFPSSGTSFPDHLSPNDSFDTNDYANNGTRKAIGVVANHCSSSYMNQNKQQYIKQLQEPSVALTPVILCGIIAVLKDRRDSNNNNDAQQQLNQCQTKYTVIGTNHVGSNASGSNTKPKSYPTVSVDDNSSAMMDDITSQLVLMCQNMRQAAIVRIRIRKKRNQLRRIIVPIVALMIWFIVYLNTMSHLRSTLIQLGFVKSCDIMPAYSPACYVAEANLWFTYKDYLLTLQKQWNLCQEYYEHGNLINQKNTNHNLEYCSLVRDHAFLPTRYKEAPFTLHSTLIQDLVTFEELDTGVYQSSLYSSSIPVDNRCQKSSFLQSECRNKSLRWLGETSVNRLVREAIDEYLPSGMERHILDAGCGVGGSLYALLPESHYHESIRNGSFSYHGISSSTAEVTFGRGLLRHHNLEQYANDNKILLEQKSFEEKLPAHQYSVVVAIESMSFSRNIDNTISNLLRALKPGGLFIIIDDVVYPTLNLAVDEYTIRPSLFSHTAWKNVFAGTNSGESCRLIVARDLSLEYDIIHETSISSEWLEGTSKTILSTNGVTIYKTSFNTGNRNHPHSSQQVKYLAPHFAGKRNDNIWTMMASPVLDNTFLLLERLLLAQTGANSASQRLMELQDEKYFLEKFLKARKEAYARTIFSYNFYVCIKKKEK